MKKIIIVLSMLITTGFLSAHEGHNQTPGSLKSLHGGQVQGGKILNLETIISGNVVTLYPVSHEGSDVAINKVTVKATAKPKKGKPYPIAFTGNKNSFNATVDLQGANRLPIEVLVSVDGKSDTFKIQVEE